MTTPENMARWDYELFSVKGLAISPGAHGLLLDSFSGSMVEIGGRSQQYGYHSTKRAISLSNTDITAYGHPGGGTGGISVLYHSPELDTSISLLANSHTTARSRSEALGKITHSDLDNITQRIFDIFNGC